MLGPCEAFHQLRFIALNTSYSLNPADNYFEDMVKAWPNLEIFEAIHVPACFAPPFHGTLAQDTSVRSEWFWVCEHHQRKPAMKLSLSARTVYSFLDYDTEYGNDHSGYGTEWSGVVSSGLVVRPSSDLRSPHYVTSGFAWITPSWYEVELLARYMQNIPSELVLAE
ncbi:hypothetical protein EV401DRAFT_1886314 [Pisolithus croceorrhizus]|nr:hypothetical protein EV401DRAFT_1886314 [Pisolithus croceorrhizus]